MAPAARAMSVGPCGAAIDRFHAARGVVELALVWVDPMVGEEVRHRAAADLAVQALLGDSGSADVDAARGVRTTVEAFLGPHYDWNRRRPGTGLEPTPGGGAHKAGVAPNGPMTHGFADAFMDPPYGLAGSPDQAYGWFTSIWDGLLGGLADELAIWSWTTDWSTWFDAGHEWWGSFCWTVASPETETITVVLASSTD